MASTSLVIESWGHVNATPGYEEGTGQLLFRHIFQLAPEAQHMFGFGKEFPIGCEEVYKTEQFRKHSIRVVSTVNAAITMLSNSSLDDLVKVLKELGVKHAEYEAKKEHYVLVGQALIMTLEKALSPKGVWTDDVKNAWVDIYQLIQDTMLQGAAEFFGEAEDAKEPEKEKSCVEIVQQNWAEVKEKVHDYERVIGALLFRRLFAKVPDVQNKFGFGKELPIGSEELYKLERFENHAAMVVKAVDKTVKLLRPGNVSYAKSYLFNLGAIHAEFQTTKEHYELFSQSFVEALKEVTEHNYNTANDASPMSFTEAQSKAWIETFDIISSTMMEGSESF